MPTDRCVFYRLQTRYNRLEESANFPLYHEYRSPYHFLQLPPHHRVLSTSQRESVDGKLPIRFCHGSDSSHQSVVSVCSTRPVPAVGQSDQYMTQSFHQQFGTQSPLFPVPVRSPIHRQSSVHPRTLHEMSPPSQRNRHLLQQVPYAVAQATPTIPCQSRHSTLDRGATPQHLARPKGCLSVRHCLVSADA